jgi:hypothetical protein
MPTTTCGFFEADKDTLNDPNKIQIGQELVIPVGR